jgi:hypothetical protein
VFHYRMDTRKEPLQMHGSSTVISSKLFIEIPTY